MHIHIKRRNPQGTQQKCSLAITEFCSHPKARSKKKKFQQGKKKKKVPPHGIAEPEIETTVQ